MSKYGNRRTWSALVERWFASNLEARRGEQLALLEMIGEISDLEFQVAYILSDSPKVKVVLDFRYREPPLAPCIIEDAKGVLTAEARVKYAWLKQKHNIEVVLWRG